MNKASKWVLWIVAFISGLLLARLSTPARVIVSWETASEVDAAGFRLYRSMDADGPFELISQGLILAEGDPLVGAKYEYIDTNVTWGERYYYQLEEINLSGAASRYDQTVVARAGLGWTWAIVGGIVLAAISSLITGVGFSAPRQTEPDAPIDTDAT